MDVSSIETRSLSRRFGTTEAVADLTMRVERGEIFGFLGPNGAGKTTTIRMLTGLLPPSGGSAAVLGLDVEREGKRLRSRIGVVQQGESYEYTANVDESLDIYGLLWNIPKSIRKSKIDELLEVFGLETYRRKRVQELSIGLRRRLQVAREFMHEMDLLFLDEPTIGLDPIARRSILEMIKENARRGLTVFLTTHTLDEAEYLCNRVGVMDRGRLVTIDTPKQLKDRFGGVKTIEVALDAGDPNSLALRMRSVEGVSAAEVGEGGVVRVWTTSPGEAFNTIVGLGDEMHLKLANVTLREPTLEQAFINLLEKEKG